MNDSYLYIIVALLPLTAGLLVTQVNPYHALILRGVLGAVAALVDAVLGAADVALTEALMGTMLSVALYAIAVRSSLVLRLGVIENQLISENQDSSFQTLIDDFRNIFSKHYMRLEIVPYNSHQSLQNALKDKEVHATCAPMEASEEFAETYQTEIRVQRIYNIIESEISSHNTVLNYVDVLDLEEKHS
jgi:putative multicomponent Na+:H+ antiporter subunit B